MLKSIYMDDRWGKIQEIKEKGTAYIYEFEKDSMKLVYPFIKREAGKINNIQYYDLATARGESGPRIETFVKEENLKKYNDFIKLFNLEFETYCQKENIVAEYIRFDPWNKQENYFNNIYDISFQGNIYCNDLETDFFMNEYRSQKRNEVKKSAREGVEILFGRNKEFLNNFLDLYEFTQKKYNVGDYYHLDNNFMQHYIEALKEDLLFVQAVYQGKAISSAMLLIGEDILHYHFAASHPEYRKLNANIYLLYESALYGKKLRKKYFDLGGATPNSNLEKFKNRIGNPYSYYRGTKIRDTDIYNKLVEKTGGPRENYFPAYRQV